MREIERGVIKGLIVALLLASAVHQGRAQNVAYYSMQNTNWPPWPTNIFPALNVTSMGGGRYAVDDTAVDYGLLVSFASFTAEDDDSPPAPGDDGGTGSPVGSPAVSFGTNLWIEILQVTNSQAFLRLHNTVSNELYQLQSKTNLVPGNNLFWIPGEILLATNTNVDFSPVDATPPNQFFRGQHGTNEVWVAANGNATRPNPPSGGQQGSFQASRSDRTGVFPALTIFYRMSGSAIEGQDYDTLPGFANFGSGSSDVTISVTGFPTNVFEFEEQIILTLIPTNTYLINTNNGASATIGLEDNFTNSAFQLVTTTVTNPAGIAYHPLSNWLIVSFDSVFGDPVEDFLRIDTNGIITNWTSITGLQDEIKLAIVQTNTGGFTVGDMFFGTGTNSIMAHLSADGAVSNLDWLTLTPEAFPMRLSLHFDNTGVFSNDLVAATGDFNGFGGGNVWRITSGANATLLTNIDRLHLEGVTTLTTDTNKYGPWAGKILTGSPQADNLFAVDTNGHLTTFSLNIGSEDMHIIPTNQDFYLADRLNSLILKLPRTLFTNFVGDVMITQEGEPPSIFILRWDTNSQTFLQWRIPAPGFNPNFNFEHGTFAPMNVPASTILN